MGEEVELAGQGPQHMGHVVHMTWLPRAPCCPLRSPSWEEGPRRQVLLKGLCFSAPIPASSRASLPCDRAPCGLSAPLGDPGATAPMGQARWVQYQPQLVDSPFIFLKFLSSAVYEWKNWEGYLGFINCCLILSMWLKQKKHQCLAPSLCRWHRPPPSFPLVSPTPGDSRAEAHLVGQALGTVEKVMVGWQASKSPQRLCLTRVTEQEALHPPNHRWWSGLLGASPAGHGFQAGPLGQAQRPAWRTPQAGVTTSA